MNQLLASDHNCLCMLWAFLSFVLDHLFQNQQCWQCFTQIIIGAVPQPTDAFYVLTNCALPTVVTMSVDVADKIHFIVLVLWKPIMDIWKSTHNLVTQWSCPDKAKALTLRWKTGAWDCGLLYANRHQAQTALLLLYPMLATIQMAPFSNEYPWTDFMSDQIEITHNTIRHRIKFTFLETYVFIITQPRCHDVI